jgi:alpha-tubulin suppressor-like RCC1 family protein
MTNLDGKSLARLCGNHYTFSALTTDGKVFSWGKELGGYKVPTNTGYEGINGKKIVDITQGDRFILAIMNDGTLQGYGYNSVALLGTGTHLYKLLTY